MVIYFILFLVFAVIGTICLIINKALKFTNWYRNQLQYVSLLPTLDGDVKYDVVNIGSNPARFAFFYENINGANLSTGTQDLYMDLCILKYYSSRIKKGAYILIPIVPFSSVTAYLTYQKLGLNYYMKFQKIDWCRNQEEKKIKSIAEKKIKYPLLFIFKSSFKSIFYCEDDQKQLEKSEMTMMYYELVNDARQWMNIWKAEFDIHDLNAPLNESLIQARNKSVELLKAILNYCIAQEYKPVLILPPLQKELSKLFTLKIKENYVYSFIREIRDYDFILFDYMDDERFSDSNLFINTLFMNLKGRKLFTNEVMKKLNIISD